CAIGAIDDSANMRSRVGLGLKVRYKFIWHTLIALVPTIWLYLQPGMTIQRFPGFAPFDLGWLFIPLGVIAIFATAAGSNEIDGLDGLAAGTCAFSFVAFLVVAIAMGQGALAGFCAALVGALIGYLWFNVAPAQVFMGDTGSLPLGAGMAVIAMQ